MTLEEAIEFNLDTLQYGAHILDTKCFKALQLGIEALKRCKTLAENSPLWAAKPLPGETKE